MLALFLYANMAVKEACGGEKEAYLCVKMWQKRNIYIDNSKRMFYNKYIQCAQNALVILE